MDVYLDTLGCRLNEAESAQWGRTLRSEGHRVVASARQAQVIVLNTCAVTAQAVRKSRKRVRALHRANPRARLVLTGCHAELEPEAVAELAGVDLVIGNLEKEALVALVTALDQIQTANEQLLLLFSIMRTNADADACCRSGGGCIAVRRAI